MSWENFERTSTILNNEDEVRYVVEESCIPLHNKKVLVVIVTFGNSLGTQKFGSVVR